MNKILFLITCFLILFSSCSSDSDSVLNNIDSNNEKKYVVNLDIQSDAFKVDKTPMKNASFGSNHFVQIVAYKESGEVYSDSVIYAEDLKDLIDADNTIPFSLELPAGKYHLAVLSAPKGNLPPNYESNFTYFVMHPENYNTDRYSYFSYNPTAFYTNYNLYYNNADFEVFEDGKNSLDTVVLEPMWSNVTVNITDIKSSKLPEGTAYLRILYQTYYKAFYIKTKLAMDTMPMIFHGGELGSYAVRLYDYTDEVTMSFSPAKGEDDSMGIKIEYIKHDRELERYVTIGSKEIKFDNKFENGRNYKITGKLSDAEIGNAGFSIKINALSSDSIDIPFE